jgi:DNA-binding Lrp family transcriptional regulator
MKQTVLNVLTSLMEDSKQSDREIAVKCNISQPTVSRCRAKLERKKIIKGYAVIPDLHELGFELVVISKIYYVDVPTTHRLENELQRDSRVIFACRNPQHIWVLSKHKNFTDYLQFNKKYGVATGHYAATDTGIIKDPAVTAL